MSQTEHKAGMAMIVVICFTAVAAVLAIGLWIESGSHLRLSQRQEYLEQAFYVAEGGAERAVTYIRAGGAVPGTITGALGRGTYSATILALDQLSESGGQHTLSGRININPDNHADYQFLLVKPDGSSLSRADLTQNQPDYSGPAHLVHVNPKGNSDQVILVDGVNSILDHNSAYTFT
ncbi:MAG: hypothetical protein GX806_04405, partial [Lentisphaerae bacterium]|nr:hypothetical protein [Lentisphaerota bacterium]